MDIYSSLLNILANMVAVDLETANIIKQNKLLEYLFSVIPYSEKAIIQNYCWLCNNII